MVSGLNVQFEITGTPRKELPAGAELTIYRCVQESLTNVIKHAGPEAKAQVQLEWTSRGLNLSVIDDGRGAGSVVIEGAGQGLLGMRERVALYEGSCTALPSPVADSPFQSQYLTPRTNTQCLTSKPSKSLWLMINY